MRPGFAATTAVLVSIVSLGCETTDPTGPLVESIRLQPTTVSLVTGEYRQLAATPLDRSGDPLIGYLLVWHSADPTIATVSASGLVSAVGAGQTTISASLSGATASAVITVIGRAASVEISPNQATLDVLTDQVRLTAMVRDDIGIILPGWAVFWTSSDPLIAQVGPDGQVFPQTVGTATISARSDGRTAQASITVVRLPVVAVIVSPSPIGVVTHRTRRLAATVLGPGGKVLLHRAVSWASLNPLVVGVNTLGVVTGHNPGDATITATVEGHVTQVPLTVFDLVSFSSVTTGYLHTCSLSAQGPVFCWGDNSLGQLGGSSGESCDGGFYYDDYPCATEPMALGTGADFIVLSAGYYHTCAVSSNLQAYCWGNGGSGELGQGSPVGSGVPVAVLGGLSFASIAAGGQFSCGVTVAGAAHCWGNNGSGQLGDGTVSSRSVPVAVLGGLSFLQVSAGGEHTCGITTGSKLYCWGRNHFGQLGDGSFSARSAPVAVAGNLSAISVAAGSTHTCAIIPTGVAHCWGRNLDGQLGNGSAFPSPLPIPVAGGGHWKSITAGAGFTCGIASDDRAHCWGSNYGGQLGIGSLALRNTPAPVVSGLGWEALSAGGNHTCGRTTLGMLFCWGAGYSGELGTGVLGTLTAPGKVLGQP